MKKVITFLFLFCSVLSFGQNEDPYLRYSGEEIQSFAIDDFDSDTIELNIIDSTLSDLYQDFPTQYNFRNSLGNIGLAGQVLDETYWKNEGYSLGQDYVDPYLFDLKDNRYYQTKVPYVYLGYLNGPRKYQSIDLLFTENVSPELNFTAKFHRFSSEGYYIRQKAIYSNFELQSNYLGKGGRYGYLASWILDIASMEENGGVLDVEGFNVNESKIGIPIKLSNASNVIDKRIFYLNQFYRFGKSHIDSNRVHYSSRVVMENTLSMHNYVFQDLEPSKSFYQDYFNIKPVQNPGQIEDLVKDLDFRNKIGYVYSSQSGFSAEVGGIVELMDVKGYLSDSNFYSIGVYGKLPKFDFLGFNLSGGIDWTISGYNSGGYNLEVRLGRIIQKSKAVEIYLTGAQNKSLPAFKYLSYSSTHMFWNNSFAKQTYSKLELGIESKPLSMILTARIFSFNHFTYYSYDARPVQLEGSFNGINITLQKLFRVKPVYFDLKLMYNDVPGSVPMRVPQWSGYASVYYMNYIFKGALEWKAGFDFYINTEYRANSYLPLTRSFILQDDYLTGAYPFVTVFISARIKRAQGYVKFTNLGQGLFGGNYMMVPGYPMQDRGLFFGVSWDFMN